MPYTRIYGLPYEHPQTDQPGITLHGGDPPSSPILAEEVERVVNSLAMQVQELQTQLDAQPQTVEDVQTGTYSFSATGNFGGSELVTSGTYAECAVVFTAPSSGRVEIHWAAEMAKSGTGPSSGRISPEVREGAVIGTGPVVLPASINRSLSVLAEESDSPNMSRSMFMMLPGLTPGQTYNARLLHRGSSGSDITVRIRRLLVRPAT